MSATSLVGMVELFGGAPLHFFFGIQYVPFIRVKIWMMGPRAGALSHHWRSCEMAAPADIHSPTPAKREDLQLSALLACTVNIRLTPVFTRGTSFSQLPPTSKTHSVYV